MNIENILLLLEHSKKLIDHGYAISFDYKNDENSIYVNVYNNTDNMIYSLNICTKTGIKLLSDKVVQAHDRLSAKILNAEHDYTGTLMIESNSLKYLGEFHDKDKLVLEIIINSNSYDVEVPIKEIVDTQLT